MGRGRQDQAKGFGCLLLVLLAIVLSFLCRDAIWGRDGFFQALSDMLR